VLSEFKAKYATYYVDIVHHKFMYHQKFVLNIYRHKLKCRCFTCQHVFFIYSSSVPDGSILTLATNLPFIPLQYVLTPSQLPMPQVCVHWIVYLYNIAMDTGLSIINENETKKMI